MASDLDYRCAAEWMATHLLGRLPDRNTMTAGEIADYEQKLTEIVERVAAKIGMEPIWRVLITRAGESYGIDGYRPDLRDAWDEAEADLIKMGWLTP